MNRKAEPTDTAGGNTTGRSLHQPLRYRFDQRRNMDERRAPHSGQYCECCSPSCEPVALHSDQSKAFFSKMPTCWRKKKEHAEARTKKTSDARPLSCRLWLHNASITRIPPISDGAREAQRSTSSHSVSYKPSRKCLADSSKRRAGRSVDRLAGSIPLLNSRSLLGARGFALASTLWTRST